MNISRLSATGFLFLAATVLPIINAAQNPSLTASSDNALAGWVWRGTGSLNTARFSHTATLLQNGMVLVAGGLDNHRTILSSVELYDPASQTWSVTGSLNTPREVHTATLLPNGM